MAEVLSQSEIDALLAAMAAGEVIGEESNDNSANEEDVPSTVLENSPKFDDKDIHILEYVHKEYANVLTSSILGNSNGRVSLEFIQEMRYEEFMHSIPYPAALAAFKLNPLDGYLLFETSPSLIFQIENILSGKTESKKKDLVEFSEADKNASMKIAANLIEYLEEAWSRVLKIKPEVEYLEFDLSKVNLFSNTESVVLASFSVNIEEEITIFNLCIPYSSIEKYSGKLEVKSIKSSPKLSSNFGDTNLNVKVVLDNIQLTLRELMDLEKGTILNTHRKYKNKAIILVEEKHCFNGELGLIRNRKAVKIVDCLDKDV
ncbi:flagellar motor switch protein FliM [Clostridium sp. PL3]|uniref:Flagellar motor switch protein FliM n=1 Tax=Clostridium thailandense TaxID=2794346 RepID=A0A949TQB1_9CLOT|nr:FliM/FliN family flagellar motor switch protein [Clostridium thailandense]MBV7274607.1 flagellar motor switch protein FliM [Clostridium thailandense]